MSEWPEHNPYPDRGVAERSPGGFLDACASTTALYDVTHDTTARALNR
jgi:hypothetical protein